MKKLYIPYGFPGSGKGWSVKGILASDMKRRVAGHLVLGDNFRAFAEADPHGTYAQIMGIGGLIPDEMTNPLVISFLLQHHASDRGDILLLDGYPRTRHQAEFLLTLTARYKIKEVELLNLVVEKKICRDRLVARATESVANGGGRLDDKLEVIDHRLSEHEVSSGYILPFYREHIVVHDIPAEKDGEGLEAILRLISTSPFAAAA